MKNAIPVLVLLALALAPGTGATAQSTLDQVLSQIGEHNQTLRADSQYREAQKLGFRTGLAPGDPTASYDFLSGRPADAGDQHEFIVVQPFDFPTAYARRSQLATQQAARAALEHDATRQQILLEAKGVCLALIYRNKLQSQLEGEKRNAEDLLRDFQTRLEKGDGNLLDVNKASLQLAGINREYRENASAAARLREKLAALNGGMPVAFADTLYPVPPAITGLSPLEAAYEKEDPLLRKLEQQKAVTQKELELSRALWLPKFEAGYRYQGLAGQSFSGIHTAVTIPLWQNRNTVNLQKAKLLFDELNLQDHRTGRQAEIKQLFEKYGTLQKTLEEYRQVLAAVNSAALLEKALALGEISTIEYFLEINYYNAARRHYLEIEWQYHDVIAALLRYQL